MRAKRGRQKEIENNEMKLANVELVARRSARLKDLYQQLNDRCVCVVIVDGHIF